LGVLRGIAERTIYGYELSRNLEMNQQIFETASGHTPRQSAPHDNHQHTATNHQRAEEAQRHHNKSERRTLTGKHSQRHAHDHGIQADNATVSWSRP
jgi:hypothetical protein